MNRHIFSIVFATFLLAPFVVVAQNKPAPTEQDKAFDALFNKANKAYNDSDYAGAIKHYKLSAQHSPHRSDVYRNMARAYFWLGQYPAAVAYYDIYLTEFPKSEDTPQIERERRLASTRSTSPWALPSGQKLALRNLEKALAGPTTMARGGGGAWSTYQALLQSGYAHPNLIKFRKTLSSRLLAEHDAALAIDATRVTPLLNLEGWELEKEHLDAALTVTDDRATRAKLKHRALLHESATALLLGRYDEAAAKSKLATEKNPEFQFPRWWRIAALMHAGQPKEALDALDVLDTKLGSQPPEHRAYARVLRAMLLQQLGQHDKATELFISLIP